jgi:Circularly permutated YpsA SLOG family
MRHAPRHTVTELYWCRRSEDLGSRYSKASLAILINVVQIGYSRAVALDWAVAHNVPCGGWCPKGRKAEDGPIDPKYPLKETPSAAYIRQTEWNARDSDATVLFSIEPTGANMQTRSSESIHFKNGEVSNSFIRWYRAEPEFIRRILPAGQSGIKKSSMTK